VNLGRFLLEASAAGALVLMRRRRPSSINALAHLDPVLDDPGPDCRPTT